MSLIQEKSACYSSLLIRRSLSPLGEIPNKMQQTPNELPTKHQPQTMHICLPHSAKSFQISLIYTFIGCPYSRIATGMDRTLPQWFFENLKPVEISENPLNILWTSLKVVLIFRMRRVWLKQFFFDISTGFRLSKISMGVFCPFL
jgi:hypothetical protein